MRFIAESDLYLCLKKSIKLVQLNDGTVEKIIK